MLSLIISLSHTAKIGGNINNISKAAHNEPFDKVIQILAAINDAKLPTIKKKKSRPKQVGNFNKGDTGSLKPSLRGTDVLAVLNCRIHSCDLALSNYPGHL